MTKCIAHFQTEEISPTVTIADNSRIVRLYGTCHKIDKAGYIGKTLPDRVERLGAPTSTAAFDFLTISMAVTAADTFFRRKDVSDNGWARDFDLHVPVVQPDKWTAARPLLQRILNFLQLLKYSYKSCVLLFRFNILIVVCRLRLNLKKRLERKKKASI